MCLSNHPLTRHLHIEQQCSQWQRSNKGWHTSSRPHLMNLLKKGNLNQNRISVSARNKKLDFPAPCTEAAIGNCFYRHRHFLRHFLRHTQTLPQTLPQTRTDTSSDTHRHFLRHTQTLPQAIGNCFNRHFLSCFIRSGGSSAPACHSRHFTSYYTLYFILYTLYFTVRSRAPARLSLASLQSQQLQVKLEEETVGWITISWWIGESPKPVLAKSL